jgi:nitrate reductase gamma subunit
MSELLDLARGPVLEAGLTIFAFGVAWRLGSLLLLPRLRDRSPPRPGTPPAFIAAGREILRRLWPQKSFVGANLFSMVNGYAFHLALLIIVVAYAPHMLFIKGLFGLPGWPTLPNAVINVAAVIAVASLSAALIRRLTHPVLRLISTLDDYFSWFVTILPVVTGIVAVSHVGARYETLLAIHIMSVALFLAWLPFGKLMHAFLVFMTRGATGVYLSRRGAQL